MVYFFNGHPIYRPTVVTGQDTINYNINATIVGFKQSGYFENTTCNILGESSSKLLVPHKTTTFFRFEKTGRLSACHKTCWILSPPTSQFKGFKGFRNLSQTFWYWLNPVIINSPMSIVSKVFFANLEQWLQWKFSQFIFENLVERVVVTMIPQLKIKKI